MKTNDKKIISLTLQNKELKRENLRLHKKIAKLEVEIVSLKNKSKLVKSPIDIKLIHEQLKKVVGFTD